MNPDNCYDCKRHLTSQHHENHSSYPNHSSHQAHHQTQNTNYCSVHSHIPNRHIGGLNAHLHKRGSGSNLTAGRNSQLPEIQIEYEVTVPLISSAYHHRSNPYSSSLWNLHNR